MRRLAIPDAAAMLALHPSEVRALVEDGRLEGVRVRGRWLISCESVQRLNAGPPDDALLRLEERVAELERRLESFAGTDDEGPGNLRPALRPLFRTTE